MERRIVSRHHYRFAVAPNDCLTNARSVRVTLAASPKKKKFVFVGPATRRTVVGDGVHFFLDLTARPSTRNALMMRTMRKCGRWCDER
jgi:hypothetical protein